jgi:hypothetical protein
MSKRFLVSGVEPIIPPAPEIVPSSICFEIIADEQNIVNVLYLHEFPADFQYF